MTTYHGQKTKTNRIECAICHVDREQIDIYFKHDSYLLCKFCLVNGLTRDAENMFSHVEDEVRYYKKIGYEWDDREGDYVRVDG